MTKIATNTAAKLSVAFVTVAMIFTMFAPATQAQTADDLAAQIAQLLQQIQMLESQLGGSTGGGTCVAIQAPLTMGSQNADVTALQNFLINAGEVIPAGATGYFGSQTKAALASWQAANGVSPAVGYYGPITKAAVEASCVPVVDNGDMDEDEDMDEDDDSSNDSNELGNGEGDIDTVSEVSSDESNVEEGQLGGILAFEVEIDGDVMIDRMDFYMEVDDGGATSDDADDYFTAASLWMDGEMIAEVDVDDFDEDDYSGNVEDGAQEDDEYRVRFSGLDLVFEDGDEPEFQLAVEVVNNLDSTDLNGDWYASLESIRFVDGQGFNSTYDAKPTNSTDGEATSDFGFDAEEVAELSITKSSDSEDAKTVEVDDNDESAEFPIMILEIEEENDVDVVIDTITMTASTTEGDVTTTIDEVILVVDGEEIGSDSPSSNGALEFDNLDLDIAGEDTVEIAVHVVFNGTDDYNEGDEVFLTFNAVTEAEDENGNDEGDISGSNPSDFSSDTFTLRSEGIAITLDDVSAVESTKDSGSGDIEKGTYEFEIVLEAFGEDFFIDEDTNVVDFDLVVDGVVAVAASSTATLTISGGDAANTSDYRINRGDDVTLTLRVETADDVSGSARVRVNSVSYGSADNGTENLTVNAAPAVDWRSAALSLTN